jgi:hypothetical protein
MFAILNLDARYTISPCAFLDSTRYSLCFNGRHIMTFATKKAAVELAQLLYGEK